MNQRIELEKSNQALTIEMQKMRVELSRVIVERDMYKQKLAALTAARDSITIMDSDHSGSPERYR
jgi:chaperonin cofactor prefoldin